MHVYNSTSYIIPYTGKVCLATSIGYLSRIDLIPQSYQLLNEKNPGIYLKWEEGWIDSFVASRCR